MKNKLVIIGCGGHARSVADIYLFNYPDADIIFVDEKAKENEKILGFPVVKNYNVTDENVFIAIGDNKKRAKAFESQKNLCSIISKNAYIGKGVEIGKNVLIAHNSHIGIGSKIENNVIINTSTSIDHECIIGENSHIAPNSTLCGRVKIGKNVFIGAGSTVIDNISICNSVILGAGSIIYRNIDEAGTYVETNNRKIK